MMHTTVSTQPQIIIVACCITLRRSAYDTAGNIRSITKDGTVTKSFGYTNASWPDLLTSVTANGTTKDVLYAVRDGATHVSVRPVGGTMDDWISTGSNSVWTQAVKSVVIKWDGAK